nr:MAG TPA: Small nuclear RNA activating complex subunit [Caudoviricetes sp.]
MIGCENDTPLRRGYFFARFCPLNPLLSPAKSASMRS